MDFPKSIQTRLEVSKDLMRFLWVNRLWWMMPMTGILLLLGALLVLTQGSPAAPFIYALF
ncbi:MAG: hypothetical protein HY401_06900 [Elusimicrobia bacterium]|nr:hypothetical protein [Elusimicrobiota bacterium]